MAIDKLKQYTFLLDMYNNPKKYYVGNATDIVINEFKDYDPDELMNYIRRMLAGGIIDGSLMGLEITETGEKYLFKIEKELKPEFKINPEDNIKFLH
jgi:hypothetical protein